MFSALWRERAGEECLSPNQDGRNNTSSLDKPKSSAAPSPDPGITIPKLRDIWTLPLYGTAQQLRSNNERTAVLFTHTDLLSSSSSMRLGSARKGRKRLNTIGMTPVKLSSQGGGSVVAVPPERERRDSHHRRRCPAGCGRGRKTICLPCGDRAESLTGWVGLDFYLLGLKILEGKRGRCGGSDVYAICWRRCDEAGWIYMLLLAWLAVGLMRPAGFLVGLGAVEQGKAVGVSYPTYIWV